MSIQYIRVDTNISSDINETGLDLRERKTKTYVTVSAFCGSNVAVLDCLILAWTGSDGTDLSVSVPAVTLDHSGDIYRSRSSKSGGKKKIKERVGQ